MHSNSLKTQFVAVMKPSFWGGVFTVALSVVVLIFFLTPLYYDAFSLDQYNPGASSDSLGVLKHIDTVSDAINSSQAVADFSVFLAWSLTGVMCFLLLHAAVRFAQRSAESINSAKHAAVDRKSAQRELVGKALLRVAAVVLLYGYYLALVSIILPTQTVLSGYVLTSQLPVALLLIIAMLLLTLLAVHTGIVLIRLVLLKTRMFL